MVSHAAKIVQCLRPSDPCLTASIDPGGACNDKCDSPYSNLSTGMHNPDSMPTPHIP
jgi:hypothetical protein